MGVFARIADHAARAVSRILTQFRTSAEMVGLTSANAAEVQTLEDAIYGALVLRDVTNANGATLDGLGKIVGAENRGGLSDANYRLRVRAQILVNKSCGTPADLVAIALALRPTWTTTVKTREGGPTAAGYLSGSPTGQSDHNGAIEIVCVPDTAGSAIPGADAIEMARYLKSAAAAGVRPILFFRDSTIAANQAFRFSGGSPPETAVGFGTGKLFQTLDR